MVCNSCLVPSKGTWWLVAGVLPVGTYGHVKLQWDLVSASSVYSQHSERPLQFASIGFCSLVSAAARKAHCCLQWASAFSGTSVSQARCLSHLSKENKGSASLETLSAEELSCRWAAGLVAMVNWAWLISDYSLSQASLHWTQALPYTSAL